jgi:hypothetical protein
MIRIPKNYGIRRRKNPIEGRSSRAEVCYCVSNHFHRSKLEARTCDNLRFRKLSGDIVNFKVEVSIPLKLNNFFLGVYRCDFVTEDMDGGITFIEAKGIQFPLWKLKWKILQAMYSGNQKTRFVVIEK